MKGALALIAAAALLALGVWSAVALGAGNDQRETSTVATTTTTTTGETTDTSTGETTDTTTGETTDTTAPTASKVWVCHHTGSWKHPYHLIQISTHALHAHLRIGDVLPDANNSCPTAQPAEGKNHGHGKGHGPRPNGRGKNHSEAADTSAD
jgi:cytoskeletal protein RodZ